MPVMLSKTYDALIAAGTAYDKARAAAEELADYKDRLASIDNRLVGVEGKLSIPIWGVGVNAWRRSPFSGFCGGIDECGGRSFDGNRID